MSGTETEKAIGGVTTPPSPHNRDKLGNQYLSRKEGGITKAGLVYG